MKKYLILVLLWLSLVPIFAVLGIYIVKPDSDLQLTKHGIRSYGLVTAKEPDNHRIIRYTYTVGGQTYSGVGHEGNGNPPFENIIVGQQLLIFYDPANPQTSCLGYPAPQLKANLGMVIFLAIVAPTIAVFSLARKGYFKRFIDRLS